MKLLDQGLHGLCEAAQRAKQRLHGNRVYYSLNLHINYTDYCVARCAFCAFWKTRERSRTMTPGEVADAVGPGLTEVHITGGLNPELGIDYYTEVVRLIKKRFPNITVKAFTATEIAFIAEREGTETLDILRRLRDAGLDALPGGGAEILSERLHHELFPGKAGPETWLRIHRQAHSLGLRSNATMLFGHLETREEIIAHLEALRQLQDETGGFMSFIPLPFQTGNNLLGKRTRPVSPGDILRTVALSRLYLDNFPHIKAYWVMMGRRLASVALACGASDIDGTVGAEKVAHSAGAETPRGLPERDVRMIIRWAGANPVRRDGLYHPI